jgi:cytochrome P450
MFPASMRAIKFRNAARAVYIATEQAMGRCSCFTGPRQISTTVAAAVPALYSSTTRCNKAVFYNYAGSDPHGSLFATRGKKVHSQRRKAWDRAFNGAALANYGPSLFELVSTTIAQMRSLNGKPTDATEWGRWFAFDAMGKVIYYCGC